jgi:carbon monoxide dehydrogenase subunit G
MRERMELKGTHKFAAPPQAVWSALHNEDVLVHCVPGADTVTWQGENAVTVMVSGIGPLKGPFGGTVQVAESAAPTHMKFDVSRRQVNGSMTVDLAPDAGGTLLAYTVVANLSGALAAADNPLTRPILDGQVGKFFSCLESQIR